MHLDYQSPTTPSHRAPSAFLRSLIPSPGTYMAAIGFVASAALALWWPSATLFCVPACVGAMVIPVMDWFLRRAFTGIRLWVARAVFVTACAALIAFSFSWGKAETFERAFGMPAPPGVTALTATARAAGPGDVVAHLRFKADRATLDKLLAARQLTADDRHVKDYRAGAITWAEFARLAFRPFDWRESAPPAGPLPAIECYEWRKPETSKEFHKNESLRLYYDPPTGDTWVLYVIG